MSAFPLFEGTGNKLFEGFEIYIAELANVKAPLAIDIPFDWSDVLIDEDRVAIGVHQHNIGGTLRALIGLGH